MPRGSATVFSTVLETVIVSPALSLAEEEKNIVPLQQRCHVWCVIACCVAVAMSYPWAMAQSLISAKIGIQLTSENSTVRAKTHERARKGDLLRIYVVPHEAEHVYVVHTDGQTATLLNQHLQRDKAKKDEIVMLPDNRNFYQIDGNSTNERFTIVCSPTPVPEMQELLTDGKLAHSKWLQIEKTLVERGKIDLSAEVEKPIALAGNTRALEPSEFVADLPIYSGKSLLVKYYDFTVAQ
jgi:hypothetical protein